MGERAPRKRRAHARVLTLAALLGWGLGGWTHRAAAIPAPTPRTPATSASPQFHEMHVNKLDLDCINCHQAKASATGRQALNLNVRPGHAMCQDCHYEVKKAQQHTKVCMVCHAGAAPTVAAFPSGFVGVPQFSHAQHVDPRGRLNPHGVRADCVFCHTPSVTARRPVPPDHAQCAVCHARGKIAKPVLDLSAASTQCTTCHSLQTIDAHLARRFQAAGPAAGLLAGTYRVEPAAFRWQTARGEIYRDIVSFPHQRHLQRRDGRAIDCITCHGPVLKQTSVTALAALPSMKQCEQCHGNATYVRQPHLTKHCAICHEKVRADLRPLSTDPVSPQLVHTDAFRRFHHVQAADPDAVCGSCHPEAVNVKTDRCAGCHSSMQPRSHLMARWSDLWHGRQAALDRTACAACHAADFCVKCHSSVLPRSHVPLNAFIAGRHAQVAALDLRGCFTCHSFQQTCAECHDQQLRPLPSFRRRVTP
jgi:Cytochrome c7 and related cytochrome c